MTSLPPDNSIQPPRGAADRRDDDRRDAARAPRSTGGHGPIGFDAVMRTVGKQRAGANPKAAHAGAKAAHGHAGHGAAGSEHAEADGHASSHAAAHGGTVTSQAGRRGQRSEHEGERSDGTHVPGSAADRHAAAAHHAAGSAGDASVAAGDARWLAAVSGDSGGAAADATDAVPVAAGDAAAARAATAADLGGAGGRVTPARAMELVEDVARSMDRDQGVREVHIRLEPEHLGPLAVKLTVDQRGIRARIATRTDGAAAVLGTGKLALRDRLLQLGYASADVEVERDDDAFTQVGAI